MTRTFRILIPLCVLACGFAAPVPADAVENFAYFNPGAACQLSIPGTDAQVRPRATGFRNESTTKGAFVICGYSFRTIESPPLTLTLYFHSIDGVGRTINCTAVTGTEGLDVLAYSTKLVQSSFGGPLANLQWNAIDFGGAGGIPNGDKASVTCNLPPQTSITMVMSQTPNAAGN
jgi:hypothetical protein